jgi:aminopeptidase-like protein
VPDEWTPLDAYIITPEGKKIADFKENNLHLVGYSEPFRGKLELSELKEHLYSLPEVPDAVPYITSYYKRKWGFCLPHNELMSLKDGVYEVVVDSKLEPGCLEIGEAVLPGKTEDEVLFSSYLCHPSLANNELSGPLLMAFIYDKIKKELPDRRFTYRFVFSAETIGTICYLYKRGQHLKEHLKAGYVLSCIGDKGDFGYVFSRNGETLADKAVKTYFKDHGFDTFYGFDPSNGSDERQYCSPGFDLPVGVLTRTRWAEYQEYHTSFDNKSIMDFDGMAESVDHLMNILRIIENNRVLKNQVMFCEPRLGKRGLYPDVSQRDVLEMKLRAQMWLLNMADGNHDLIDIAERSGVPLEILIKKAEKLEKAGLISTSTF